MVKTFSLPHTLTQQIIQRAGGNPFFIEEVVRSLFDQGAIVRREDRFEVTEKASAITIPSTISDVLMARIDRLDEKTRHLVKVASVIGRSFFLRILSDVASEVEDIPGKLSFLSEIQILQAQERMGEVEYLFKHALAHETAYKSILPPKRKEIHLKVAHSIEKIFSTGLPEFYGMLAYHYSQAEDLGKAEEYLIKAGEEALRSAASDEALHYYGEALQLYLKNAGSDADPEKVAMLEKNIGSALFNRGHYGEAVEHFDKALDYYWGELPKNIFSTTLRFISSFATFLLALYFPSFWFQKIPTERDAEVVDLFHKKADALAIINPKRIFIEIFFFFNTMVRFDLTKFKLGIAIFVGASAMFSFTGISHRIGRRILDYAKPMLAPDDVRQRILYDLMNTQHLLLKGQWNEIAEYNEDLVSGNLRIGEMYYVSQHYYWHGLQKIYQGYFDKARLFVTKLSEIAEAYDNNIYRLLKYLLNIQLLIECRNFKEANAETYRGVDLVQKNSMLISQLTMQSLKASLHLLMNETKQAGESLEQANRIRDQIKAVPIQLSFFYRSQFEYYLRLLEDSLESDDARGFSKYRGEALKSGKMLLKFCQKAALYRTESYRLMGTYNWLIHDRKSAFKCWHKAISEGEGIGARPQVSRTYAEMGKRISLVGGKFSEHDGVNAQEFIQKAEIMFQELGLQYDLENLNSVTDR